MVSVVFFGWFADEGLPERRGKSEFFKETFTPPPLSLSLSLSLTTSMTDFGANPGNSRFIITSQHPTDIQQFPFFLETFPGDFLINFSGSKFPEIWGCKQDTKQYEHNKKLVVLLQDTKYS